jgi:hypothetical protein
MDKVCKNVLRLVAEAQLVKQDKELVTVKLREIKAEIQKMKALNDRARS